MLVLFRAEQGRLERLRTYSAGCALDAGGLPVVWLTDVRPAESVKLLRSLVASGGAEEKAGRVGEPALAALAFHADPSALEALMGLARRDASGHVRGQALFWLGQSNDPRALAFFEEVLKP
jgi:PBS lyase HEAT-like repeat-containing protein